MLKKCVLRCAVALSTLLAGGAASAQDYSYGGDQFPGCVVDIAASLGKVYAIGCDGNPDGSIWQRTSTGWQQFAAGSTAVQVEVSGTGVPWIRKSNGKIYRWNGSTFVRVGPESNCASDFGVGWENGVWELGCNGTTKKVYQWNGSSWVQPEPTARASGIGVGLDNVPWLFVDDGGANSVWRWSGSGFQWVDSCVSAVGGGGWVVGCDGNDIWQWSNGWRFGGVLGADVTGLTADGTFAHFEDGTVINQSKFETFSMSTNQLWLTISGSGKYFDSGSITVYWENSTNGQLMTLKNVSGPNASGVVNFNQESLTGIGCVVFKDAGLKKSSPPQKMWLSGSNNRWASITNNSLRDVCWNSLPN